MTKTKELIRGWVIENFGDGEADDPSWNIETLAEFIDGQTHEIFNALPYRRQFDLVMEWDFLENWTGLSQKQKQAVYDTWMSMDRGHAVSDELMELVDEKNMDNEILANAEKLRTKDVEPLPAEIYHSMLRKNLPEYFEYAKEVRIEGDTLYKPEIVTSRERVEGKDSIVVEVRFGDEYHRFAEPITGESQRYAVFGALANAADVILHQTDSKIPGREPDPLGVEGDDYSQINARLERVATEQAIKKEEYQYKGSDSGYFVQIKDSLPIGIAEIHLQSDDAFERIALGVEPEGDPDNYSPTGELWVGEYCEPQKDGTLSEMLFGYWGYESIEHILCEGDAAVEINGLFAIGEQEYKQLLSCGKSEITEQVAVIDGKHTIARTTYIELVGMRCLDNGRPGFTKGRCELSYALDGEPLCISKDVAHREHTPRNTEWSQFYLDDAAFGIDRQEVIAKAQPRIEADRPASSTVSQVKRKPREYER